ncbi:MAG: NADH-quinone oxidoreductase subunit M [Salinisphaeraceae bacterium]|nr:NADH-quinone oxidoreductase subunit M [Salinisphaeraceae bacterium]
MSLLVLLLLPLLTGVVCVVAGQWARWLALLCMAACLALGLQFVGLAGQATAASPWIAEFAVDWISRFGIRFHLAMDGLSLLLVLLTALTGLVAIAASWQEIQERAGLFYANLLWTLAGVIGIFLAQDLFLFFVCWEAMLVPMFVLIILWGHEQRTRAAIKFFIFTQAGGLLLLAALVVLATVQASQSGQWSFAYNDLLQTEVNDRLAWWLLLGFVIGFAVKLPSFPLHPWLPDAHSQASTGGSVILAAILLKTGAYGLIRFAVPFFPQAVEAMAPLAMSLGVASILYGAVLAFGQSDIKRLIACSSISHMGFVMLAVFAWNEWALQGAVMTLIAHGLSSAALFMLAGVIYARLHSREMAAMGGLWRSVPGMAALAMFWTAATVGLPGLSNFVGEFLVLLGSFQVSMAFTVVAALGMVGAATYALLMMQRVFFGPLTDAAAKKQPPLADLDRRECTVFAVLALLSIWLGVYPAAALQLAEPALQSLLLLGVQP